MNLYAIIVNFFLMFHFITCEKTRNDIIFQNQTCGGVFTENRFILESPNYPKNYPKNQNCYYVFKGPNCPAYYEFYFIDFQLENSTGCTKDRLVIENQDALCGKDGHKGNNSYFASNGSLIIRFISDDSVNDTGYKILVTRTKCENKERNEMTSTDSIETIDFTTIQQEPTTMLFHQFNLPIPKFGRNLPRCCLNTFSSKKFIITSPNFPYSLNKKQECIIKIQKADRNICRLRLTFLYFWLGSTNYNNCPYGWFKIDGKFICGCNKELKLTTTFENNDIKELVFRSEGVNLNSKSGFIIEFVQDECPTKYYPIFKGLTLDDSRREQSLNIKTAQLITEKSEIIDDSNLSNFKVKNDARIIKSYYFFSDPSYNTSPVLPHEYDSSIFVDTSTISVIVTNTNQNECNCWNNYQINNLFQKYGNTLQTCKRTVDNHNNGQIENRSNCVELNNHHGYFNSPGYPFYYPKKLNMCYRLRKQSGYCKVRVYMTDFQLQSSYGCYKDYVLLENKYRYCSKSLLGRYLTFDLTDKSYADIIFVTNYLFCGRGFSGVYEHLPCQGQSTTDYPFTVVPITNYPVTVESSTAATTSTTDPVCDKYISKQSFIFEIKNDLDRCTLQIRKFSEKVCKIVLTFKKFDLFCGSEALVVDDMMLCGHLTGRKVSVNFEEYNDLITVVYRSSLRNKYENFKLNISGEQIIDDCFIPEPPVQR